MMLADCENKFLRIDAQMAVAVRLDIDVKRTLRLQVVQKLFLQFVRHNFAVLKFHNAKLGIKKAPVKELTEALRCLLNSLNYLLNCSSICSSNFSSKIITLSCTPWSFHLSTESFKKGLLKNADRIVPSGHGHESLLVSSTVIH